MRRTALIVLALLGLLAGLAPASAGAVNVFRHSLAQIDQHLRNAIEYRPEDLGEGLIASERVCGLALQAEARGDAAAAAADWDTLGQAVRQIDRPNLVAIDGALARADSGLRELRRRFAKAWAKQADKRRELRRGVSRTRQGIRGLGEATDGFDAALAAWERRECGIAERRVSGAIAGVPAAVELVNFGMYRLWRLLEAREAGRREAGARLMRPLLRR